MSWFMSTIWVLLILSTAHAYFLFSILFHASISLTRWMIFTKIQQLLKKQSSATRFYISESDILKKSINFVSFKAISDDYCWHNSYIRATVSLFKLQMKSQLSLWSKSIQTNHWKLITIILFYLIISCCRKFQFWQWEYLSCWFRLNLR